MPKFGRKQLMGWKQLIIDREKVTDYEVQKIGRLFASGAVLLRRTRHDTTQMKELAGIRWVSMNRSADFRPCAARLEQRRRLETGVPGRRLRSRCLSSLWKSKLTMKPDGSARGRGDVD